MKLMFSPAVALMVLALLLTAQPPSGSSSGANATANATASANGPSRPGRILLYIPLGPKSIAMMVMPIAEALAARGHQVVFVTPIRLAPEHEGIRFIHFEDPFAGATIILYGRTNLPK